MAQSGRKSRVEIEPVSDKTARQMKTGIKYPAILIMFRSEIMLSDETFMKRKGRTCRKISKL